MEWLHIRLTRMVCCREQTQRRVAQGRQWMGRSGPMYDAKKMADEVPRMMLFRRERRAHLPQTHQQHGRPRCL